MLVHAGLAVCLLHQAPSSLKAPAASGEQASDGVITVSLSRSALTRPEAPATSAAAPDSPKFATRAPMASVPVLTGQIAAQPTATDSGVHDPSSASPPSIPIAMATPAAKAGDEAEIGSDYQRRLLEHIEPFKRYPDEANRQGVVGVVQLLFEIDRHGRVLGVWVAKTSGSKTLDAAAVETVRRAAPLPPIPIGLPDAMAVQLPVQFSSPG